MFDTPIPKSRDANVVTKAGRGIASWIMRNKGYISSLVLVCDSAVVDKNALAAVIPRPPKKI